MIISRLSIIGSDLLAETSSNSRPNSTDLYSEIGPLTRASRSDFDELAKTLNRIESECKLAWDYLKVLLIKQTSLCLDLINCVLDRGQERPRERGVVAHVGLPD